MDESDVSDNSSDASDPSSADTSSFWSNFSASNLTSGLNNLGGLAKAGNTLYSNLTGTPAAATSTTSASLVAALPYIIGVAILVVLLFVFKRK